MSTKNDFQINEEQFIAFLEDAVSKGIIKKNQFDDYTITATRKEVARLRHCRVAKD